MPREWQSDQRYIEHRDPRMARRPQDDEVRIERRSERLFCDMPSVTSASGQAVRSGRDQQGVREHD
jgi:hypothetical protein